MMELASYLVQISTVHFLHRVKEITPIINLAPTLFNNMSDTKWSSDGPKWKLYTNEAIADQESTPMGLHMNHNFYPI